MIQNEEKFRNYVRKRKIVSCQQRKFQKLYTSDLRSVIQYNAKLLHAICQFYEVGQFYPTISI